MEERERPCPPMRAGEDDPNLRELLDRCHACKNYLEFEECLNVVVRLSNWLDRSSPKLSERIRQRMSQHK